MEMIQASVINEFTCPKCGCYPPDTDGDHYVVILQYATLKQWLPSTVAPFDQAHEDLLYWLSFMTFFIVWAIEESRK